MISIANYSQDRMYVSAENGLNVMDKPSLESNKIFHLPNNTMVLISKKTGINITLIDDVKEINGEWIKIYSFDDSDNYGYVFDGFLSKEKPEIWYSDNSAYYKTYSHENFKKGTYSQKSTLKKYYTNQNNLLLLKVETLKLDHLIWEQASDGNMFPHLYSTLDLSNIVDEFEIKLSDDDIHKLPDNFT